MHRFALHRIRETQVSRSDSSKPENALERDSERTCRGLDPGRQPVSRLREARSRLREVRVGSPTFGQHAKVELNDENHRQFWIPRGCAHGFIVLSDSADFFYKADDFYSPADELVLKWDDPALGIDWGEISPKPSQRDRAGRSLADLTALLPKY